jgi:hypothetical protein
VKDRSKLRADSLVEAPTVGVSQNDLHFAAHMVLNGFGCEKPESPVQIIKSAVSQATFELRYIADKLEREDAGGDVHILLMNICDRLDAGAETAEILMKLHNLPHAGQPSPSAETAGE